MAKKQREARLLSIDGAGLKAIVPALVLSHIEKVTGKPINKSFHFCAATSASAILPMALSSATAGGQPIDARDLAVNLMQQSSKIFGCEFWTKLRQANFGSQGFRSARRLERLSVRLFKKLNLSDCSWDILLPLYDMEKGKGYSVKSWLARGEGDINYAREQNFKLRSLAEVSFAPPSVFGPRVVWDQRRKPRCLVDCSFAQSNPLNAGRANALDLYPNADRFCVLSLGVGEEEKQTSYLTSQALSSHAWMKPMFELATKIHQEQMPEMALRDSKTYRFDPMIKASQATRRSLAWGNLDAISLKTLEAAAQSVILEADHNGLSDLCAHLIEVPLTPRNQLIKKHHDDL